MYTLPLLNITQMSGMLSLSASGVPMSNGMLLGSQADSP